MKKRLSTFISSILAGFLIGVACIVKIAAGALGAYLFGLGLFLIILFKLFLYTGKIGLVLDNDKSFIVDLLIGLIGNFIGIVGLCLLFRIADPSSAVCSGAEVIVNAKEDASWYKLLIMSVFCGFMIYLAVKGYNESKDGFERVICVFLCITFFILSGYEHCVANAGYYALAGTFTLHSLLSFALYIIGNSIGSILLDALFKLKNK